MAGVDSAVWSQSLEHVCKISQDVIDRWADQICRIPRRKQQKGYSNWIEGYVHDIEVKQHQDGCLVKGKCNPSMRKNNAPYVSQVKVVQSPTTEIGECSCNCKAGNGHCSHVIGLLYTVCHFKKMGFKSVPPVVAKTSLPQAWHVPHRQDGIRANPVDSMVVNKVKPAKSQKKARKVVEGVVPKVFCPVEQPIPAVSFADQLVNNLSSINSDAQALILLSNLNVLELSDSKYGQVPRGSVLSYQQSVPEKSTGDIIQLEDAPELPVFDFLPLSKKYMPTMTKPQMDKYNGLYIARETALLLEEETRLQSECYQWKAARKGRLTSSIFKRIVSRRKDFEKLASDLTSTKRVTTQAMQHGIDHEPIAAKNYADIRHTNVYLCGFVVNPDAPYLGASPDRRVYDPSANPEFGLLEIKCPVVESFKETKYLKERDGNYKLSKNHDYYHQVMGQMAITGSAWCDFFVQAKSDYHLERIYFDASEWEAMQVKLDKFFFEYFL